MLLESFDWIYQNACFLQSRLDKKDIILAELDACRKLLRYAVDETEKKAIETEILELQLAIDLMH